MVAGGFLQQPPTNSWLLRRLRLFFSLKRMSKATCPPGTAVTSRLRDTMYCTAIPNLMRDWLSWRQTRTEIPSAASPRT